MERFYSQKPMNTKLWKNRLDLMKVLASKKCSESIHLNIEKILKTASNKEQKAKEILDILIMYENEKLIQEKLFNIQNK